MSRLFKREAVGGFRRRDSFDPLSEDVSYLAARSHFVVFFFVRRRLFFLCPFFFCRSRIDFVPREAWFYRDPG